MGSSGKARSNHNINKANVLIGSGQNFVHATFGCKSLSFASAWIIGVMALLGLFVLILAESLPFVHLGFKLPKSSALKEGGEALTETPLDGTAHNASTEMQWVQFPVIQNETERLLRWITENGTEPCHGVRTHSAHVLGLPSPKDGKPVRLIAGPIHELTIISIAETGERRCAGGDFYETDLSGKFWKSRPPVVDHGDGSYQVRLQVDPRFAGHYAFKVVLLYANFHAMHPLQVDDGSPWIRFDEVFLMEIEFVPPPSPDPHPQGRLRRCGMHDYELKQWSGRWTRDTFNESCAVGQDGRFSCLDPDTPCEDPWCEGPVGRLESNGWVYSAHCRFKLFTEDEAWQCLDGKWLFWWGDSNNLDTARNLLNFVLGCDVGPTMQRRTDRKYFRAAQLAGSSSSRITKRLRDAEREEGGTQFVRITNIFNGHADVTRNYQGLFALTDATFRAFLSGFFGAGHAPDVMIMNSGLHDGCYWQNPMLFVREGLELAAGFWKGILDRILPKTPRFIYRTTVAVGGRSRARGFNPHKMEVFNKFFVERLQRLNLSNFRIVDGYDLTFPWHFDNDANDGAHYGKAPSRTLWVNGKIGHQYFVDLMLVHMLLNAICDE